MPFHLQLASRVVQTKYREIPEFAKTNLGNVKKLNKMKSWPVA